MLHLTYHYWISKLMWRELWLVDTASVTDWFPPLAQASENLTSHPCPGKSQLICLSSRRSKWDAIIARMKAQIRKLLFPVRYVACTYTWQKRETVFWSIICNFQSWLHCLLYNYLEIIYSCVDCLVSFYHKYCAFM